MANPVAPEISAGGSPNHSRNVPNRTDVSAESANRANRTPDAVETDELLIEEPKNLLRGETHVRVIGGGRDRPVVVLEDDEICSE